MLVVVSLKFCVVVVAAAVKLLAAVFTVGSQQTEYFLFIQMRHQGIPRRII